MAIKYPDLDTNSVFEKYVAAEGREREEIAEDLYERGKVLYLQIYWRRFRDVPRDIAEELFHDALIYSLERGIPGKNFQALLSIVFVNKTLDWIRKAKTRVRTFAPLGADPLEEEGFWSRVHEPTQKPADFDAKEKLEQTLDCLSTLPGSQRLAMELFLEGLSTEEIEKRVPGSVKDHMYHARQNLRKCLKEQYGWED